MCLFSLFALLVIFRFDAYGGISKLTVYYHIKLTHNSTICNIFWYLKYDGDLQSDESCYWYYSCTQFDSLSKVHVQVEEHFDGVCVVQGPENAGPLFRTLLHLRHLLAKPVNKHRRFM